MPHSRFIIHDWIKVDASDGAKRRFRMIEEYLQKDSTTVPEFAANQILITLRARPSNTNADPELFGADVADIALQFSCDDVTQEKLVILVHAIKSHPGNKVWSGSHHTDDGNWMMDRYRKDHEDDATEEDVSEDLNITAFAARLYQSNFDDYTFSALCILREGLEKEHYIEQHKSQRVRLYYGPDRMVQRAAVLVEHCAPRIWEGIVRKPQILLKARDVNNHAAQRGGGKYDGTIVGLARWKFWRNQLEAMAARTDLSVTTRHRASHAAKLMQDEEDKGTLAGKVVKPERSLM